MVDARERFVRWQQRVEKLRPVVSYLLESRRFWRDLRPQMLVGDREYGHAPNLLYAWYVESTILQVRRLVDPDDRTYSLRALLEDIRDQSELVTRGLLHEVVKSPRASDWTLAEIVHGRRGAEPPDRLTTEAVQKDIDSLVDATKRTVRVGHGYVAHLDEDPRERNPRIEEHEIETADAEITRVYLRYRRFLLGSDLDFGLEYLAIGWRPFMERVGAPLRREGRGSLTQQDS